MACKSLITSIHFLFIRFEILLIKTRPFIIVTIIVVVFRFNLFPFHLHLLITNNHFY